MDIDLLYPETAIMSAGTKLRVMRIVRTVVATHMGGVGYEGESLYLAPDDIDIVLQPYNFHNTRLRLPYRVRIFGHDYPDRMANIEERCGGIASNLSGFVSGGLDNSQLVILSQTDLVS